MGRKSGAQLNTMRSALQQRPVADLIRVKGFPPHLLLLIITLAVMAPFLNKAFHIDDALFLWMADQIARHPLDPYGFKVNWTGTLQPMWIEMQNPPLCSCCIAVISAVFGGSEIAIHSAFLIWAILAVLGAFALAQRFSERPIVAALLTLFTPVFLVSATNVMCDLMLVALYTWAVECWVSALEKQRWWLFALSAFLICAATLTKYFGISLVALLGAYTLFRDWRSWPRLLWLVLPVLVTVLYELWTKAKYGHGLFTEAAYYAKVTSARYAVPFPKQILFGWSFFGGCFFTALLFLPLKLRGVLAAAVLFIIGAVLFRFAFPPGNQFDGNYPFVLVEGGIFIAAAWIVFALGVWQLWRRRDAASLLLILWILGAFAFSTFLNWSVTARTMLPAAPAVAILIARFTPHGPTLSARIVTAIIVAAAVSLGVTLADYRVANTAQEASRQFQKRFQGERGTIWFQSHWGFQFYMQQWGARALNLSNPQVSSGDVMIIPANNTAVISVPEEEVYQPEQINFPTVPLVSTVGFGTGASFYSSVRGPLPWMFGRVPPEMYYVARFR